MKSHSEVLTMPGRPDDRKILTFMQKMADRMGFGFIRHQDKKAVDPAQDYLARLEKAIERYKSTGNLEFLVDAANYCYLESVASLHPNQHWKSGDSHGWSR